MESLKSSDKSTDVIKRRGLMAAAWAAVLGIVLKRSEQPVEAATGLQFQNVMTDVTTNNIALGPTAIQSSPVFPTAKAVFSSLAAGSTSRTGLSGAYADGPLSLVLADEVCGVLGFTYSAAVGSGVLGLDGQSTKAGVIGRSGFDGNGFGVGVQGESGSGTAVKGLIKSVNQTNAIALYGQNDSTYAGPAPGAGGFGVYGSSAKGHGLVGATSTAGGAAVVGATNGVAGAFAAAFYGPVIVSGNFVIFGTKSAAVPHPDGSRRLVYCMESPDSWFEDFGKASLECGRADVTLDPDFAAVVDLSDYHVFLTGYNAHDHLAVMTKTATGFSVAADVELARLKGRTESDLTGTFSWRVVARRKDVAAPRFAPVTMPPEPVLPKPDHLDGAARVRTA